MKLTLKRKTFTAQSTTGDLLLNGKFFCHTLEDSVCDDGSVEMAHKTAIPVGKYRIELEFSPKLWRILIRLLNVPGFRCIVISQGTSPHDTWGSILVGDELGEDAILRSTAAFDRLYSILLGTPEDILIEVC